MKKSHFYRRYLPLVALSVCTILYYLVIAPHLASIKKVENNTSSLTDISNKFKENPSEVKELDSSNDETHRTQLILDIADNVTDLPNISKVTQSKKIIDNSCVVFTRVDKTGSTYVRSILTAYGYKMQFTRGKVQSNQENMYDVMFNINERKKFMEWILTNNVKNNTMFGGHALFFNFDELDEPRWPLYFSIVRNPLEKFISHFYHMKKKLSSRYYKHVNETLDNCIKLQKPLCDFSLNRTLLIVGKGFRTAFALVTGFIPYFCGYQPICRYLYKEEALQLAKSNVEKHYQFVGIMEEMNVFFEMLEKTVPVFNGIVAKRQSKSLEEIKSNVGRFREQVSEDLREYIVSKLRTEFDFYYFIRARMCLQYNKLFPERPAPESCLL